ncbi:MAG: T9SS type A sorting domain-containing protein [Bacteroidota bacterium]
MMRTTTLFLFLNTISLTFSKAQSPVADSLFASNSILAHGVSTAYTGGHLVEQTDGKIILGSCHYTPGFVEAYIDLVRFDRCGMVDSTFGVNGIASVHFDFINTLDALKLQSDGKILCSGIQAPSTAGSLQIPYLARLNSDGSPDSSFNGTGSHAQRFDAISSGTFTNIDILPDGRILASGICGANINGGQYAMGAMRFMPDGTLDTTFSGDGIFLYQSVTTPVNHSSGRLRTDGNAVLSAHLDNQNGVHSLISVLIDSTGNLVSSFGTAGLYTDPTTYSNAGINFNTIDNNNNLLTVGQTNTGNPIRVSRILSTGVIDNSFGVNGFADLPSSVIFNAIRIKVAQSGKIMLLGTVPLANMGDGILQLNPNGTIDSTFGVNGIIYTQMSTVNMGVVGVLELTNNKMMIGFVGSQAFAKKFTSVSNVPHIADNGVQLSSTGNGTFLWFLNNVMINGATQNNFVYTQNGSYTVMITDIDGCTYMSDPYIVSSVGIAEWSADGIIIYPNPASEIMMISGNEKTETFPEIYNSFGQKSECNIHKDGKQFYLDVSSLSPGVYFVIVNSSEKIVRKSFVKE